MEKLEFADDFDMAEAIDENVQLIFKWLTTNDLWFNLVGFNKKQIFQKYF